jgi:hypothetical protein
MYIPPIHLYPYVLRVFFFCFFFLFFLKVWWQAATLFYLFYIKRAYIYIYNSLRTACSCLNRFHSVEGRLYTVQKL